METDIGMPVTTDFLYRKSRGGSAVAADPEDDVLPGRYDGARIGRFVVAAGEDDGVVLGDRVQVGLVDHRAGGCLGRTVGGLGGCAPGVRLGGASVAHAL